jgi:hypothetical protein
MKFLKLKMRLIAPLLVMCCLIGAGGQVAQAQVYLNDTALSNFTGPITSYATFTNFNNSDGCAASPFTPTSIELTTTPCRVYNLPPSTAVAGLPATNNWILATFPSAVSTIVVFPNIDHVGSAFDGYQYTIQGSNDGMNWTPLFDATSVNGVGEPFTLGTFTGTAPLFVNNVLTTSSGPGGTVGYIAFFDFGTAYKIYAFGASTVATASGNTEQELSAVGTGPAAITQTLVGNGADNSFQFGFATYHVIYPLDVTIAANTTMTISPNVLAPADCNSAINISAFSAGEPKCTTYSNTVPSNDSVIFDLACSVSGAPSTSAQCPTTTGFNPFTSTGFHSSEDILNDIVYSSTDNLTGKAPQLLTAPEGTQTWVAFGVGFTDCTACGRGGGGSSYNSMVVSADFPGGSAFTIPAYTFTGFQPPVANPPTVNLAKAGSTVPIKFCVNYPVATTLGFNDGPYTTLNFPPLGYLQITAMQTSGGNSSTANDNIIIDTQTTAGLLNLGGGCYNFGWKTPKSLAGESFTVTVDVGDGVSHDFDITFQ